MGIDNQRSRIACRSFCNKGLEKTPSDFRTWRDEIGQMYNLLMKKQSRAKIQVIAKFYGSSAQGGYGHLGIAKYQLIVAQVEVVEEDHVK